MNNRCNYCINYLYGINKCKFCHFEPEENYTKDNWDILNLDEEYEWIHLQIRNRLHSKGLPCTFVDVWSDNNIVILLGCNVFSSKIAEVLGVHEECIYNWTDQAAIIINIYMEKSIRKGIDIDKLSFIEKECINYEN